MRQDDIDDLHELMQNFLIEREYKPSEMMAFLTSQFLGTMAMYGYTHDFFNKTIDRMKDTYPHYLSKFTKVIDEKRK